MKLTNKRIIITGGTSGIGYYLVKLLYQQNDIIVISRDPQKLDSLSQQFNGIITFQANLARREDIETVANTIVKRYNSLDVLINNAAAQNTATFLEKHFKYETIYQEITLNFAGICGLSYLLLPCLLQEKASLIFNVNSGLALAPKTHSAVYCATKSAINAFTQSLRYQLEETNIQVQQAFLELVDTPMTAGRGGKKRSAEKTASQIIRGIEQGIPDNDIGKVKHLRLLLRIAPSIAKNIMKKY